MLCNEVGELLLLIGLACAAYFTEVADQHQHCPVDGTNRSISIRQTEYEDIAFILRGQHEGSVNWKGYEMC